MALIGYARVSVLEEESWHQHDHLEAAGCARIFTDRASGAHEQRPELARCFDHLRDGDVLVVWRLERLGRSLRDLVDMVTALGERGIAIRSLDESMDTTGADGPTVLQVCGALAEFELDIVRERAALAAAGVREPRRSALAEAARSLPSWRVSAAPPAGTPDAPPAATAGPAPAASAGPAPAASAGPAPAATAGPAPSASESTAPAAQPPPAGPAVTRPPRSAARRRALMAVQVGFSLAAAGAAFHVARSDADTARVALTRTAVNRDVQLRFPGDWRRASADLSVAALGLDDAIVLTLGRAGGSTLMAGLSPATGATLLTPALRRRLAQAPRPVSVRLGAHNAQHFADLRLRDSTRSMTVFVVPTTRGALTLACLAAPRDVATVRDVCHRVAQTMRPRHGRALALGPSSGYQADLNELLGTLDATRVDRRAKLASARTAAKQARLADELSSAYAEARVVGSGERVSPREADAHRRIIAAIDEAGAAYERLGNAAGSASVTRYDRARAAVTNAERRVRAALAALAALGYAPAATPPADGS